MSKVAKLKKYFQNLKLKGAEPPTAPIELTKGATSNKPPQNYNPDYNYNLHHGKFIDFYIALL